jgi:hypothetical protein
MYRILPLQQHLKMVALGKKHDSIPVVRRMLYMSFLLLLLLLLVVVVVVLDLLLIKQELE